MIAPGTLLGSYRVESLIGQGGMGHVYRAVDTRLDRVVAIKTLPAHLSSDPHLRERFEREARAISSLSHPHICALFDVGREDGQAYLVMEFVEGESLADRLSRGPLPLDQVIRYGADIAEALGAAHQRGIVHRDLKPGNVMITKSGAKLLDFGLARTGSGAIVATDAPTEHQKPLTEEGTLLGTFQYMAPEQIEGVQADARTDVFALGAVLYEMVTGKRAYEGKSKASLIASILDREPPPIAASERAAPAALDRLIRACLAKEPDERVQSARDVAMQLRWIGDATDATRERSRRPWLWPALAVALAGLFLAGAAYFGRGDEPTVAVNLSLLPPAGFEFDHAAISRQGSIAFSATRGSDRLLFVRELHEAQPRQVGRVTSGFGNPFWSPDGKWIAYFDRSKLLKLPVAGGTPEVITDSSYGFGATWSDDGTIVFTPGFFEPLHTVPAAGGKARPLTTLDASRHESAHGWPVALPDDGGVLYISVTLPTETSRIFHVPLRGGKPTEVLEADALVGFSEPYLLFVRNGDIHAVEFDPKSVRLTGQPRRVVEQVAYDASASSASASVTPEGVLLFPTRATEKRRIVRYDRQGRAVGTVFEGDDIQGPRLSPDGNRMLLSKWNHQTGTRVVHRVDLERGTATLLTPPPRFGFHPLWLPDGETFAYTSARRTSDYDLFTQLDDPQAEPVAIWEARSDDKEAIALAPDGEHIVAREYKPDTFYDIWLVPVSGKGERKPLLTTGVSESWADISPDGRWLAFGSNVSSRDEVYVRPMTGGRSIQVSTAGGIMPRWSRDGREVYFLAPGNVLVSARFTAGGRGAEVGVPEQLFAFAPRASQRWELHPDGTFLVNELADTASAISPYNVVTGWKERIE